jgi:hypothetical protein
MGTDIVIAGVLSIDQKGVRLDCESSATRHRRLAEPAKFDRDGGNKPSDFQGSGALT